MASWQYYADNGASVYPQSSQGAPFNAASIAVTGDAITNLFEDLAAEQKARAAYDNILRLSDDPDVNEAIKFLRQREIVHFQRFGEAILTVSNRFLNKNYQCFKRNNQSLSCVWGKLFGYNIFSTILNISGHFKVIFKSIQIQSSRNRQIFFSIFIKRSIQFFNRLDIKYFFCNSVIFIIPNVKRSVK